MLLYTSEALKALPALRRWLHHGIVARRQIGSRLEPPSVSQVRAMIHLHQFGPQTMGQLAKGLGVSCSTATECVAGLVARERVARSRSTSDRRHMIVALTPEAEAIASQVLSTRTKVVETVLRQLRPEERQPFVRGLTLLSQQAEHSLSPDEIATISSS